MSQSWTNISDESKTIQWYERPLVQHEDFSGKSDSPHTKKNIYLYIYTDECLLF